eukprot:scaffold131998_cov21-Tisochrysis_lutea.AAC.2
MAYASVCAQGRETSITNLERARELLYALGFHHDATWQEEKVGTKHTPFQLPALPAGTAQQVPSPRFLCSASPKPPQQLAQTESK